MDHIFGIAFALFLIANPIGNSPAIIAIIKDFDFNRQIKIMAREAFFAFLLAVFFQYSGEAFLNYLKVESYALSISGGILLLFVALDMLFHSSSSQSIENKNEPIFVPIAIPLISGPGLLSMIMIFSGREENNLVVTIALFFCVCRDFYHSYCCSVPESSTRKEWSWCLRAAYGPFTYYYVYRDDCFRGKNVF